MLDELSYKSLCQQVMDHDPQCIHMLYDNYGGALYGVIYRIVNDESVSVELLQDVFVKIWNKGSQFDSEKGRLYTWMMRIARNTALNYMASKAHKKKDLIQSDSNLVYLTDTGGFNTQVDSMDILEVMKRLDDKYQSIVKLIYLEGYTQKEVSDQLRIPIGTVKSRVRIALREMRKIYEFRLTRVVSLLLIFLSDQI